MLPNKTQYHKKEGLYHNYKNGTTSISGFLEDNAFTIGAYLDLYEVTFDEIWIERALTLSEESIEKFYDDKQKMFYFSHDKDSLLVARKMEINDNVIPASNSSIARSFHRLGLLLDNQKLQGISNGMLNQVSSRISNYGSAYSNWTLLMLTKTKAYFEIAIIGDNYAKQVELLNQNYLPNAMFMGGKKEGSIPLLEHKHVKGKTLIYVCLNKSCKLPVETASEAFIQIDESK